MRDGYITRRMKIKISIFRCEFSPCQGTFQVILWGRKSGFGDVGLFSSDSIRAWQGALAHPRAGRGPRVSVAARGPLRHTSSCEGPAGGSGDKGTVHLPAQQVPWRYLSPRQGWTSVPPDRAAALARHCIYRAHALPAGTGSLSLSLLGAQEPMM